MYFPKFQPDLRYVEWPEQINLLVAYRQHVREGGLPHAYITNTRFAPKQSKQHFKPSVWLSNWTDNLHQCVETEEGKYEKVLSQLLEDYQWESPPPVLKLVVPVLVPNMMFVQGLSGTKKEQCVGDFGFIAFYYLLNDYKRFNSEWKTSVFGTTINGYTQIFQQKI